ncbi:MAG TPA: hypothetical protein VNZ86_06630 [Bacteroidia bacterium]|jgi:hypothetical protein|nr:hypothetical protein [Bacteroidia bacterium]
MPVLPDGFTPIAQFKSPYRLLIGIEGLPDSGKTEFALSAPPGIGLLAVDRGYEHMVSKNVPPLTRQRDIFIKIFNMPLPGQADQPAYVQMWKEFYDSYQGAVANATFRTVVIDGDSDTWDLQLLAWFGKTTQIMPITRTDVNMARRRMIGRGFDSGKNIIFTYKVGAEYEKVIKLDLNGKPFSIDEKTGDYKRKGFGEQDFLVQVQLRAIFNPAHQNRNKHGMTDCFGIRILKCKPDPELIGMELWGPEATFSGLVQAIYPGTSLREWGL